MEKKNFILLLSLLFSACTDLNLIPSTATSSQTPVSEPTNPLLASTQISTITPPLPTVTFTETPTLVYLDPTPAMAINGISTETLASMIISSLNITETPPFHAIPQSSLFSTIIISGGHIYWGDCEPSFIKITTYIANPSKIHIVTLWLRLENKTTGDTTDWGGGAIMNEESRGSFAYTITAESFSHYREYPNAWGQYQLVASDKNLHRIGASALYTNNITIEPCP